MADKFIDLAPEIYDDQDASTGFFDPRNTLRWLDEHPDRVPGRTITEGEMEHKCATYGSAYETGFKQAGGVVVPEPTDSEMMFADLDDLTGDGFLIHDRHKAKIAEHLTELGWKKTSGGNDGTV